MSCFEKCRECESTTFHTFLDQATQGQYSCCTECKNKLLLVDGHHDKVNIKLEELLAWTLEQLAFFKMADSRQVRDHSESIQTYIHVKIDEIQKYGP